MAILRIKSGQHKGQEVEVDDDPFLIGRSDNAHLQILDEGASREHAQLFKIGNACFIKDLESTNQTIVNDQVVDQEELLQPGDRIQIGTTILVFEDADVDSDEQLDEEVSVREQSDELSGKTMEIPLEEDQPEKQRIKAVGEERESRSLTALYQLGKILSKEKDADELLNSVLDLTTDAISADGAYIFLIDDDTGKLKPAAARRENPEEESGVSRTIIRRVLRSSRSVLTSDAESDDRFSNSQSVVMKGIKSVIAAPVSGFGNIQGILYLYSNSAEAAFTSDDLELVTAIGIQTGVAIGEMSATEKMRATMNSAVKMLVRAIEVKDPNRQGHSERVAGFCTAIAKEIGLAPARLNRLQLAALLHDIGKLVDQEEMPADLQERDSTAAHVEMGVRIIEEADIFEDIIPGLQYHHARMDGSGYPEGVTGDEVPKWVHILIVANAFDNLLYHPGAGGEGIPVKNVLEDIRERTDEGLFHPDVVDALERTYNDGSLFETEPSIEAFLT